MTGVMRSEINHIDGLIETAVPRKEVSSVPQTQRKQADVRSKNSCALGTFKPAFKQ